MNLKNKIRIGTVQLGISYGINNCSSVLNKKELEEFFESCVFFGFNKFDTAENYGEINYKIGKILNSNKSLNLRIQNKYLFKNCQNLKLQFEKSYSHSCKIFREQNVDYILIHNGDDLQNKHINDLKKIIENFSPRIGISTYDLSKFIEITIHENIRIQTPFSFADRRSEQLIINKNFVSQLQVRSVFLQGLLLIDHFKLPEQFINFKKYFVLFDEEVKKSNLTKLQFLLAFVLSQDRVEEIVIGIQNVRQLQELNDTIKFIETNEINVNFNSIFPSDASLLDPRKWDVKI